MSVASEITRLQNAKSDLKTAINAKLSGTAITNELVSDYAGFVDQISGGGTPTTITELADIVNNFLEDQVIPKNVVQPIYSVPKTLYTPAGDHKKYVIRQRTNNDKYNVLWINDSCSYTLLQSINFSSTTSNIEIRSGVWYIQDNSSIGFTSHIQGANVSYYTSSPFDTLQEALDAICDNNTVYTFGNASAYNYKDDIISNIPSVNNYNSTNYTVTLPILNKQRISNNETIEVIQ